MQRTRNASTRRLTAKQERFVAAYDGNATAAALAAGYKSTYANRIGVQLLNNPVIAAAISFCVSLLFNYLASMRYVFKRRDDLSRSREFITFLLLSGIGLLINEVLMWAGVALLGNSALMVTITKVFATAVVMVWNFLSRKRWLEAAE